ncbi:hypothetical protein KSS87_000252 [Heliosperma pusillum]|nr:hypothetical protein KSS87_000252 [Heliosperma pusillum]
MGMGGGRREEVGGSREAMVRRPVEERWRTVGGSDAGAGGKMVEHHTKKVVRWSSVSPGCLTAAALLIKPVVREPNVVADAVVRETASDAGMLDGGRRTIGEMLLEECSGAISVNKDADDVY